MQNEQKHTDRLSLMMAALDDPTTDEKIRDALRIAEAMGTLQAVATRVGIAGGADELRNIMHSTGELSIMDRGILGLLLETRH